MLRRRDALFGLGALIAAAPAQAQAEVPPEVAAELPAAALQGSGQLTFLTLKVYDIRLWSNQPPGEDYTRTALALELQYARKLAGRKIAERSLDEMRRIGEFSELQAERWLAGMTGLFPDVAAGDRITGVQRGGTARFHTNGRFRGEVADAEFTRLFFGIWLSPRSSEPELRQALLRRS